MSAIIKVAVNPKRAEREGASEIEVKCYGPTDALAIHKNLDGTGYTITHVVSGLRVFDTRTLRGAKQARAELLTVSGWGETIDGHCAHLMRAGWRPVWVRVEAAPKRVLFARGGWLCPACVRRYGADLEPAKAKMRSRGPRCSECGLVKKARGPDGWYECRTSTCSKLEKHNNII